ncbi:MAG: YitT family protein [Xanthobacteraceae bacterium]|nr:MAG: YitT family protein [Xanthobacteraceae bacterium]
MIDDNEAAGAAEPHSLAEDVFALVCGTLLVATGLALLRTAGLATGGTSGIALLTYYYTGTDPGLALFVINLPFYVLAWLKMGWNFTLKTFAAVALLSVEVWAFPALIAFKVERPLFAAVLGGLFIGIGLLILIRHRSSLGGLGVLAVYLQERFGWRAGKVQLVMDCLILLAAAARLDAMPLALSIAGAVMLNLVLWLNHREGRYIGY